MTKESPLNPGEVIIDLMLMAMRTARAVPVTPNESSSLLWSPKRRGGMIFSPHPDDEAIVAGLALLLKKGGLPITNIPVTYGSDRAQRARRRAELVASCNTLGFACQDLVDGGLDNVNERGRQETANWGTKVRKVADTIYQLDPKVIFVHQLEEQNTTHVGTHHLVVDALRKMATDGKRFGGVVALTEYWGIHKSPNLLSEIDTDTAALMVDALSQHTGEIGRNAFNIWLPATLIESVRRAETLVGMQGKEAPGFPFGQLYTMCHFDSDGLVPAYQGSQVLRDDQDAGAWLDSIMPTQ